MDVLRPTPSLSGHLKESIAPQGRDTTFPWGVTDVYHPWKRMHLPRQFWEMLSLDVKCQITSSGIAW